MTPDEEKELLGRKPAIIAALRYVAAARRSAPGDNMYEDAANYIEDLATALRTLREERDEARARAKELKEQVSDLRYGPDSPTLRSRTLSKDDER